MHVTCMIFGGCEPLCTGQLPQHTAVDFSIVEPVLEHSSRRRKYSKSCLSPARDSVGSLSPEGELILSKQQANETASRHPSLGVMVAQPVLELRPNEGGEYPTSNDSGSEACSALRSAAPRRGRMS